MRYVLFNYRILLLHVLYCMHYALPTAMNECAMCNMEYETCNMEYYMLYHVFVIPCVCVCVCVCVVQYLTSRSTYIPGRVRHTHERICSGYKFGSVILPPASVAQLVRMYRYIYMCVHTFMYV